MKSGCCCMLSSRGRAVPDADFVEPEDFLVCPPAHIAPGQSKQRRVAACVRGIAGAGRRFEPLAIDYLDGAPAVFDQAIALKATRSHGDTNAAHTEHACQELLGSMKAVGVRAVLTHQEPARQARADLM